MRLYLAAAWSRKDEVRMIADALNELPEIEVQARWLFEPVPKDYNTTFREQRAVMDVEDVVGADVLVRFTDDLSGPVVPAGLATGARMFEMGLAYALGKTIIVVGGIQPIFDYLPSVIHVKNVEELILTLLQRVAAFHIEVSRG
jgi:hypothetical protein